MYTLKDTQEDALASLTNGDDGEDSYYVVQPDGTVK